MQLTLVARKPEAPDVESFLLRSEAPLTWRAGQFLRYTLAHRDPDARETRRFFTIASAPTEDVVMLTTRFATEKGSSFKRALREMPVGAGIEAGQPSGDFVVDEAEAERVFVAGGIGITPYRAMLHDLDHRGLPVSATLLYANRTPDFVYRGELDALTRKHPGFRIRYVLAPDRVTEASIREAASGLQTTTFYLSGPEPMVEAFDGMLAGLGVPNGHVKRDYFPGYDWP